VIFDFSLLDTTHLLLFGGGFLGVFLSLAALIQHAARRGKLPVRRLGGAVFVIVVATLASTVIDSNLRVGLLVAAALTVVIGTLDELHALRPAPQFAAQVAVATVAVASGWIIRYVSNPLGAGVIRLDQLSFGSPALVGGVVTALWLVFLINSINWLDGSDGLASSIGVVAFATLGAVSLLPATQDAQTLGLAAAGAGSLSAFLLWNWAPARAYLGTSGAWFLGLYLGMVAIVGGGKIATTLLVLALPAADMALVITQRLLAGRPPWRRDRIRHLHFRLQAAGFTPRTIAILAAAVSAACGAAAVVLQTLDKLVTLGAIAIVLALLTAGLWLRQRREAGITK
jgi:UDP-GlcNAc:undecaprenyl-phosphate GlcNAc-1-phosphate transferase